MRGIIIRALSGFYDVDCDGAIIRCRARGKFRYTGQTPLVGDRVELTPTESGAGRLDTILERTKLSQAEYLRCAIFGTPIQEAPKPVLSPIEGLDKLIAQYGRIGNNLNQIARWLNSGGYIDRELSRSLRSALGELTRLKYDSLKIVSNYYGNHQAHCQ
jgi:hypothetical protein